jgi:Cu(I)/Ag(I) efflux system membrane fusion protein
MIPSDIRVKHASRIGASRIAVLVILLIVLVVGIAAGVRWHARIGSWFSPDGKPRTGVEATKATKETQLWTCGMHPQVIQDTPGNCPICGMALTPLAASGSAGAAQSGERKVKYWWDPMLSPPYISDKPGKSPMGMDLIPVYEDEVSAGATVTIDPAVVQNMGVRVATVGEVRLVRHIRAVGYIEVAEPNRFDVNLRVDGWVEAIHADFEGKLVQKGEPLFDLYSPALQVAVEELIAARRMRSGSDSGGASSTRTTAETLYDAAARKLMLYGVADDEIERLATLETAPRAITVSAPVAGHVLHKMVYAGAAVKAGDLALRIVDHTLLWLEVRVFAKDAAYVHAGQRVSATVEGLPAETVEGEVIFIHPQVDEATRTAMVRVALPNPDLALRPGQYATARLEVEISPRTLVVPREAVIDSGVRQIAFVALDAGHFEPRKIAMGAEGDDGLVQVLSGLAPGERVVTSGQFLLDAESRMREAIQKFLREKSLQAGGAEMPTRIVEQPAKGVLTGVNEAWQSAADDAIDAYLDLAALLGAPQTGDDAFDPSELVEAVRKLRDAGQDDAQSTLTDALLEATRAMQDRSVAEQREQFKAVSEAAIELAERSPRAGRTASKLFLVHCPMEEADWLQANEEIANPYYATTMKACGQIVRPVPIPGAGEDAQDARKPSGGGR